MVLWEIIKGKCWAAQRFIRLTHTHTMSVCVRVVLMPIVGSLDRRYEFIKPIVPDVCRGRDEYSHMCTQDYLNSCVFVCFHRFVVFYCVLFSCLASERASSVVLFASGATFLNSSWTIWLFQLLNNVGTERSCSLTFLLDYFNDFTICTHGFCLTLGIFFESPRWICI